MNDMLEIQIASAPVRDSIPKDKPLEERVAFAMRYVRKHERDLFWMSARTTEDMMLRTALAGVMLAGSDEDRDVIERSMKPLRMLAAASQGIPVDFSQLDTDGILSIARMWNDSKQEKAET